MAGSNCQLTYCIQLPELIAEPEISTGLGYHNEGA